MSLRDWIEIYILRLDFEKGDLIACIIIFAFVYSFCLKAYVNHIDKAEMAKNKERINRAKKASDLEINPEKKKRLEFEYQVEFTYYFLCGSYSYCITSFFTNRQGFKKVWRVNALVLFFFFSAFGAYILKDELTLTSTEKLERAERVLRLEEKARAKAYGEKLSLARARVQAERDKKERVEREAIKEVERLASEAQAKIRAEKVAQERALQEAQAKVKLALIEKRRSELRGEKAPSHITAEIERANRELELLVTSQESESVHVREAKLKLGVERERAAQELKRLRESPESLRELEQAQTELRELKEHGLNHRQAPIDDQTKLILSGLWLGACFFLQRIFERVFKDKGYALLTVCAAGFLLAFFTANYFLLGGSVTGGLIGSVGDRG